MAEAEHCARYDLTMNFAVIKKCQESNIAVSRQFNLEFYFKRYCKICLETVTLAVLEGKKASFSNRTAMPGHTFKLEEAFQRN